MNQVALVGRLCREPELKYLENGNASVYFTLGITREYKNNKGEYDSDFVECAIFGKSAEALASYTGKGSLISVNGTIRSYKTEKNGQVQYHQQVSCRQFQTLESKEVTLARKAKNQEAGFNTVYSGQPIEISVDDLPF
ncbi:MAG: single-stranded DNA-binding protein [Lactobacillales bacterium]|jgi:single-strand DNA-binding protein|nr:single-stranded DNA-binding protein [Lactobacillales bacterium]